MVAFIDRPNADIFNAVRRGASTDYRNRVPVATQANVLETAQTIRSYKPTMNEFLESMVNVIGLQLFKSRSWDNPLGKFKLGMLNSGDTIEEIALGLTKAKRYDPDRQSLEGDVFGVEKILNQSAFHTINRQDKYKVSVNETLLKRAMLQEDGVARFIDGILGVPQTSDQWDEFLLMTKLFSTFWENEAYFNVQVADIENADSTDEDARNFLRRVREMYGLLPFLSTRYNSAHMPTFANPDEMELFITPGANAAIDVNGLAQLFNLSKAELNTRTTLIPAEHLGVPGLQAVLTTRDWFKVADTAVETRSISNPDNLFTNYWLHHHQVVSASPFEPLIAFSTQPDTEVITIQPVVTALAAPVVKDAGDNTVTKVERGGLYQVSADATYSPAKDGPDAVRFGLKAGRTSLNTRITQTGVLSVAVDEEATTLTILAQSADDKDYTSEATVTVFGERLIWPQGEVIPDADEDGQGEVTPEAPTFEDNVITIPTVTGVQYKDGATNLTNGSTVPVPSGSKTITAVARNSQYEIASGATASWTFTHV